MKKIKMGNYEVPVPGFIEAGIEESPENAEAFHAFVRRLLQVQHERLRKIVADELEPVLKNCGDPMKSFLQGFGG